MRNVESAPTGDVVEIFPIGAQRPNLNAPASADESPRQTPTKAQISYNGPKAGKAPASKKAPPESEQ